MDNLTKKYVRLKQQRGHIAAETWFAKQPRILRRKSTFLRFARSVDVSFLDHVEGIHKVAAVPASIKISDEDIGAMLSPAAGKEESAKENIEEVNSACVTSAMNLKAEDDVLSDCSRGYTLHIPDSDVTSSPEDKEQNFLEAYEMAVKSEKGQLSSGSPDDRDLKLVDLQDVMKVTKGQCSSLIVNKTITFKLRSYFKTVCLCSSPSMHSVIAEQAKTKKM